MTGYNAYRGNQIHISTPLELVLLAYEALANAIYRAQEAQQRKDFTAEGLYAQRALAAVSELMNGLDYEQGGEIASSLGSLYVYTTQQILSAQSGNDEKIYTDLIGVINTLRSGWMELRDQQHSLNHQNKLPQQQSIALAA